MASFLFRFCSFAGLARYFGVGLLVSLLPLSAWAGAESYVWLGLPVSFKAKEYAFHSGPAVELKGVQLQTTQPIQVGHVWLKPDWGGWLTEFDTHQLRAEVDEIVATPAALMRLGSSDGPSSKKITSLHFDRLKLVLGSTTQELPAGDMDFAADATLARIRVDLGEGTQVVLTPSKDRLAFSIQTGRLTLKALPALVFDSVLAEGALDDQGIVLDKLGLNADGGAISGLIKIGLSAGKADLAGDLEFKSLNAKAVLGRLFPGQVVDGQLYAKLRISGSAGSLSELKEAPVKVSGNYTIKAGSIDRFGVLEGMRKNDAGVVGGGLVRSESFGGSFSGATGAKASVSFTGLKSGALQAHGSFTIDPEGTLAGAVGGSLRLPNNDLVSHSFVLEGKASAPVLVRR